MEILSPNSEIGDPSPHRACEAISFMGHKPWDPATRRSPYCLGFQFGLGLGIGIGSDWIGSVTSGEDIRQLTYLAST